MNAHPIHWHRLSLERTGLSNSRGRNRPVERHERSGQNVGGTLSPCSFRPSPPYPLPTYILVTYYGTTLVQLYSVADTLVSLAHYRYQLAVSWTDVVGWFPIVCSCVRVLPCYATAASCMFCAVVIRLFNYCNTRLYGNTGRQAGSYSCS